MTDLKNVHWLSERLASLGIMGTQLRAPHSMIVLCDVRGVSGGILNWATKISERDARLSGTYTSNRCCFSHSGPM